MTSKAKLGIVAILACCSMVGMGFASWTISQDPAGVTAEVSGTVTAESVLSCSAPTISELHYSSLGFTSEDGTKFSYSTTISVEYTITSGGYTGTATLTATMGYKNAVTEGNLFTDTNAQGNFLSATVEGATMSAVTTKFENNTCVVTATVNFTEAATKTVTIKYTLNFGSDASAAENYQKYFYNVFTGGTSNDVAFTFNATLAGGGNS